MIFSGALLCCFAANPSLTCDLSFFSLGWMVNFSFSTILIYLLSLLTLWLPTCCSCSLIQFALICFNKWFWRDLHFKKHVCSLKCISAIDIAVVNRFIPSHMIICVLVFFLNYRTKLHSPFWLFLFSLAVLRWNEQLCTKYNLYKRSKCYRETQKETARCKTKHLATQFDSNNFCE